MLAPSVPRHSAVPFLAGLLLLNGATVSTLYWAQSVAGLVRADLGPSGWTGLAPSATLAGYAIGVALLASVARDLTAANGLGLHALLLGAGLSAAAVAPTAFVLAAACLVIGLGCSLTQRAMACVANTVTAGQRGPAIGTVIASGLTGIVIARAVIPAASLALGWRMMFILDAAAICTIGLLAAIAAQRTSRHGPSDPACLPGAIALWRREPELRRAALRQACVFAAFNAGWAFFPRVLTQAGVTGTLPLGIVASLGAASALGAGLLCRRFGPDRVGTSGAATVLLAVAAAFLAGRTGPVTLGIMALLDVGTQAALVASQAQAQARATSPAVRGRLAAIVTTVGFAAGAVGAAMGNALP